MDSNLLKPDVLVSVAGAGATLLGAVATVVAAYIQRSRVSLLRGDKELAKLEAIQTEREKSSWVFGYSAEKLIAYNRLIEDNWLGIVYARQHEFDKAEEFYRVVFQRLENAAFTWGERFHRGLPLHNLGVVALLKGSIETAVEHFVSAYIEDCLTAGHEARGWMAAQALTKLGVSASLLNKAEQWVHTAASRPIVTADQVNQISAELRQEACRSRLNVLTQDYAFALFSPETNQDLATALGRELSQVRNQLRVQKQFTWAIFLFALAGLFLAIGALVR